MSSTGLALFMTVLGGAAPLSTKTPPWQTLPKAEKLTKASASGVAIHDGARIYYSCFGQGDPVILLHGGLANSEYWGNQIPALTAAGYRAIAIDSRGHGRSTRDDRPLTYQLMASDVIAVMDALKIERAAIVGWSDGAIIGLVMALRQPERVSRVFAFAANMDPSGVNPTVESAPIFSRYVTEAGKSYAHLSPTPEGFPSLRAAVSRMWAKDPNHGVSDLARITTPTAIVAGDHDEAILCHHTEYLARTLSRAD